jgi:hypothetical protein
MISPGMILLLFYYTLFRHEKRKKEPILSIFKFYLR